jgi:RNA-directed DNA polymerase
MARLCCGTWEPVALMLRENSKWRTHKEESIKVGHRGGSARSSDEVPVMGTERRG